MTVIESRAMLAIHLQQHVQSRRTTNIFFGCVVDLFRRVSSQLVFFLSVLALLPGCHFTLAARLGSGFSDNVRSL